MSILYNGIIEPWLIGSITSHNVTITNLQLNKNMDLQY